MSRGDDQVLLHADAVAWLANGRVSARDGRPTPAEYRQAAALRAGLRAFAQGSERILARRDLTPERYELLLAINSAQADGERVAVSDLTGLLGVAQSSVTQLVRRAEDAGLVRREVSDSDARVRYLLLSDHGEQALALAVGDLREERARLAALLKQLR
jgi:DNA-binding MarR family transcriptional regulator